MAELVVSGRACCQTAACCGAAKRINEKARDVGSVMAASSLTAFAPFGLEVWTDKRGWSMGVHATGRCQRDVGLCIVLGRSKISRVKRTRERGQRARHASVSCGEIHIFLPGGGAPTPLGTLTRMK